MYFLIMYVYWFLGVFVIIVHIVKLILKKNNLSCWSTMQYVVVLVWLQRTFRVKSVWTLRYFEVCDLVLVVWYAVVNSANKYCCYYVRYLEFHKCDVLVWELLPTLFNKPTYSVIRNTRTILQKTNIDINTDK